MRSAHCHFCGKCVACFEQHNFAFGVCTGERNRGAHLLFLVACSLYFSTLSAVLIFNVVFLDASHFINLYINFLSVIVSIGTASGFMVFFFRNFFYLLTNTTYTEYFQWDQISYLRNRKVRCCCLSPFYRGIWHSFVIYFFTLENFKF